MTGLALAAISARMLAQAARDDGFEVAALDLFGDIDTRQAAARWDAIGEPAAMAIDGDRLLAALASIAQAGRTAGWIAGAGFEGRPDLLERGAAMLPLIGTPADALRRVRDPQAFFALLDAHGIAHPPVRATAPPDAVGWLVKDAHGCGGWHIRPAGEADDAGHAEGGGRYFQREVPGQPMSATFVANGRDAAILGFNQLIVRPLGGRPFVFCGAVGPVAPGEQVAARATAAVRAAAAGFGLRGLCSLDFMADGNAVQVLEVNARPSASMALYAARGGIVAAHVRACVQGLLPRWPPQGARDPVHGSEFVFAPRPLRLDAAAIDRLAARGDCHDIPAGPAVVGAGDPLCSVSARGPDAQAVHAMLASRRGDVLRLLEETYA